MEVAQRYNLYCIIRVEICRDRRSCKIFPSCVNFPRKQRDFSHNFRRTTKTRAKCDFALKLLKIYTQLNSKKKNY